MCRIGKLKWREVNGNLILGPEKEEKFLLLNDHSEEGTKNWTMVGNYKIFPEGMTDKEVINAFPQKMKELLIELFDACKKNALRPKYETLSIIYKEAEEHIGPFGRINPVYGSKEAFRATIGAKIEVEGRDTDHAETEQDGSNPESDHGF